MKIGKIQTHISILACCIAVFILAGCQGGFENSANSSVALPSYSPPAGIKYKVGNAYEVDGIVYYPREDFDYDRTGIASWYGEKFHGRKTANGEIYDLRALTAAHKTLPLPTLVEVTNLNNNRKVILRINDRGPFVRGRIIDVSQRAAEILGFVRQGTAPVRVRVLSEQSRDLKAQVQTGTYVSNSAKNGKPAVQANIAPPQAIGQRPSIRPNRGILPLIPVAEAATIEDFSATPNQLAPPTATQATNLRATEPSQYNPASNQQQPVASSPILPAPVSEAELPILSDNSASGLNSNQNTANPALVSAPTVTSSIPANQQIESNVQEGSVYLQVGAFAKAQNARQVITKLTDLEMPVRVLPIHRDDKVFYRIQIGPYASTSGAAFVSDQDKINQLGLSSYLVQQ